MISSTHVDRASSQLRGPWTMACVPIGTATSNDRPGRWAEERRRRDADDGERHAIERERPSDDAGFAAEAALPERVADDGDGAIRPAAALVVGGAEGAAEHRRHAEHVEESATRPHALDELGGAAARQIEARVGPGDGAIGPLVLPVAQLLPDRIGPRPVVEQHQALRLADRQRLQQDAVDEREDRAVGADAKGEGGDGDERERGAAAKDAQAVAQVLGNLVEPARAARVAAVFLDLLHAAERQPRPPARLGFGRPRLDVVGDQPFEVIAELGVELPLDALTLQQPAPPGHDGSPSAASRIRPTALVSRCQLAVSSCMKARPFFVSR